MAGAKTGHNKKSEGLKHWMLDGKPIKPVLYNGRALGHGKYFACEVEGKLVLDENEKPVPFKGIGELV